MAKKKSNNSLWLPINLWNLNEVFTTESISPVSFYAVRDFGNPVNRNQEKIEDANHLVLFADKVKSEILIEISSDLLDTSYLKEIKTKPKSYEYDKTVYLKSGLFKVYFCSQEILQTFRNNTFMLLEVKTVNKYKTKTDTFIVDEKIDKNRSRATYQAQLLSEKNDFEPFFDKAFNQLKGLIYGYVIGSIGTLGENEQGLVSDLSKLKNTIGGVHTNIVLTEQYSNFWLINVHKQIKDCSKRYFDLFNQNSMVFDTLILRLEEVDNLDKRRCDELQKQKSPNYKREFEREQNDLEKVKRVLYKYESEYDITSKREELQSIKNQEKENGKRKGKEREYFKKGTYEYDRKKELKNLIEEFEKNPDYADYKQRIEQLEVNVRNYQSGYTQYDTSINEQFNRISEHLNDITKRATNFFLSKNNKESELPDVSFDFNIKPVADYYLKQSNQYTNFSIQLPKTLLETITKEESELLKVSLNAIMSFPQGRLGNYSEENILNILIEIGRHLSDGSAKEILREYYKYRKAESDNFVFPANDVLANLIVFFMKLQGHDQINKMLVAKNVKHKQIAFMLYGAYVGFANMPKTFTNIIFDSENQKLQESIDNYLFNNYLK
jgi:hypothetical protein